SGQKYLTISYDEKEGWVQDKWTGNFGTQENFRNGVLSVVEFIEGSQGQCTMWLADLSEMKGSWDSSRDWIAQHIMPRVLKAGLLFEAVVLPKDVFSKLSAQDTIMKIDDFELQQFQDIEEAKVWLTQQKEAKMSA
ncbi:MAG: hypothetical protein AAGE93_10915, partial [Bacteroidota bacterium]